MTTLALQERHWIEIVELLSLPEETGGFLLCGNDESGAELSLFGRSLRWIPDEHYVERTPHSLIINSAGYVPSLTAAHADRAIPVFLHTHPNGSAEPSRRDASVDAALQGPARKRTGADYYVSLIVGGTCAKPTFTGRIHSEGGGAQGLDRIRIVGQRISILTAEGSSDQPIDLTLFDRHVLAFGENGQRVFGAMTVGVVGAGGTGSAATEQLLRLGVGSVVAIDDEHVTKTNLTRIHESETSDIGTLKVNVMKKAADAIGTGSTLTSVEGRITDPAIAAQLAHVDVVFGCTDDQRGRSVLGKLALSHLIPVFDMGVAISSTDGNHEIAAIEGRVTTLLPGSACLLCRKRITPEGLQEESLPPEERQARADEGYVQGLDQNDPSVGVYTTLVAQIALNEFLNRLFGYLAGATAFSTERLVHLHDPGRFVTSNSLPPRIDHWCADETRYGRGAT